MWEGGDLFSGLCRNREPHCCLWRIAPNYRHFKLGHYPALGRIDLLAPAPLKLVRFPAYSPLPVTALPSMSLFPKSSIRPLGLAHLCRSYPCGSIRPVAKMATNGEIEQRTTDMHGSRILGKGEVPPTKYADLDIIPQCSACTA